MATSAQKRLVQKRLANIREANNAHSKRFEWTGFSHKTLWDWIGLLIQIIGAIAVPASIIVGLYTFTAQQKADNMRTQQQDIDNAKLVDAQQQETTLQTYLNDMTTLLFDDKLGGQAPTSAEAAVIARSKTILTLSRLLDPQRKAEVVHFLYESHLIGYIDNNDIIHPSIVKLDSADLSRANLSRANLSGADLSRANLSGADLRRSNLSGAILDYANLYGARLDYDNLTGANLTGARLNYANLTGAILDHANLTGAIVSNELLAQAKSLKGATMPYGTIHP